MAAVTPPCLVWRCLFGVVLRVLLLFGGFSWVILVWFGTVQLLNSYCIARGVAGCGFRVFFGFLPVFGGVFVCGCLALYGSEELFFRFFS